MLEGFRHGMHPGSERYIQSELPFSRGFIKKKKKVLFLLNNEDESILVNLEDCSKRPELVSYSIINETNGTSFL